MNYKIAIHERKGSFSDKWIEYCIKSKISFEKVNCYDNDIIEKLKNYDALLWHWVFHVPGEVLIAKSILQTMELMGKVVFPNMATCWHYDNKIAQKYLLESIGAPLVPTYVFFDLDEALSWIEKTTFPKVFKLSKGAGSSNVRLIKDSTQARRLARKAFGSGIKRTGGYFTDHTRKLRRLKERKDYFKTILRMPGAVIKACQKTNEYPRERNYIYFQDYIPNNCFDTRITIIDKRAFGFTRNVRPGDFRASGSGLIDYDVRRINTEAVKIAFDVNEKIKAQSIAFDFVQDRGGHPKIVEISYCYDPKAVYMCPGHWDSKLNWHEGNIWPQDAILEDLLKSLNK